jgi:hypothetical protein
MTSTSEERLDALERENAHLRLVHQKGGCPYGHASKNGCELGYPGCACMDDMLAMMAWGPEDEDKANVRIGKRLQAAEQERDKLARQVIDEINQGQIFKRERDLALRRAEAVEAKLGALERRSGDVVGLEPSAIAQALVDEITFQIPDSRMKDRDELWIAGGCTPGTSGAAFDVTAASERMSRTLAALAPLQGEEPRHG